MKTRRSLGLGLAAAAALAVLRVSGPVAAGGASLAIEPASIAVAKGATFAVKVEQSAPAATSGAQATIVFNPSLLQVVSIARGAGYAEAPVFAPTDLAAAIRTANRSGRLAEIAAAFIPPGNAPAGSVDFLLVRFRAVGCGQTDLELPIGPADATMISGRTDSYGQEVPVSTSRGHVTTCVGADVVTGDGVAADPVAPDAAPTGAVNPDDNTPAALIAAVIALATALVAALAWRSRPRARPDEEPLD